VIRALLYKLARLLGDLTAFRRGRIGRRFFRRKIGHVEQVVTRRWFDRLFKR